MTVSCAFYAILSCGVDAHPVSFCLFVCFLTMYMFCYVMLCSIFVYFLLWRSVKEKALDGAVRVLGDLKDEWESVKETLRKVWLEDEEDQSENKSEEDELDRPIVNLPSNSGTINPRLLLRAGGIDVRRRTERKKSEGENEEQNVSGLQKKIQSVVDRMLSLKGLFVEFHKQFDNVAAEYRLADSFGKQLREKVSFWSLFILAHLLRFVRWVFCIAILFFLFSFSSSSVVSFFRCLSCD